MSGELGRASYALDADLGPLRRSVKESRAEVSDFERVLDSLGAIADIAAEQLKQVRITPRQGEESRASASAIIEGVRGIKDESIEAAREMDRVKISETQATESVIAGERIKRNLNDIGDEADRTNRKIDKVGRNGVGVGPFGSGFGRIGVLGAAIGAGTVLGPAAGPGVVGLLAAIPMLATTGAGAVGALALAFADVGKAIGGDKKAFDSLMPSQQAFVESVRSLSGWLDRLKETAASNMFPGLTDALHSALSPGTLSAVTKAVAEFARAIGDAGAAWGRYFGSAEFQNLFGPLMQAGARNLGLMSDSALHLFDAMGVLARAAIPFTQWIMQGIDAGSRWAAAFLHAKDATGALGGAMSEAQTSLRLVGNLFVSIGRAVYELGAALYPVSKIAVKDLTDGFNALAGIISRNKDVIRDIVGGALAALVAMIKNLTPIVTALVHGIEGVVSAIGGWKTAFEIILSGYLALKVAKLVSSFGDVALGIGGAAAKLGKLGLAADTVVGQVGGLRGALIALGDGVVLGALGAVAAGIAAAMFAWSKGFTTPNPTVVGPSPVSSQTIGGANVVMVGGKYYIQAAGRLTPYNGPIPSTPTRDAMRGAYAPAADNTDYYKSLTSADATKYGVPPSLLLAQINQESGFKTGLTSSAGAKGIAQFMPGTAKGMGVNPDDPTSSLDGAARLMSSYYKKYGRWDFALAAYNGGPGAVDYYLKHGYFPAAETTNYVNSILGASNIPGGAEPGSTSAFGDDPAFTKNLGAKPPKPPVIPNMITDLLNKASANASKSKQLGDVGGTAKRYLENELDELTSADKALHKLVPKTARDKQQVAAKETQVENKIRDVNTLIKNAIFATGDAILPASLKARMTALTVKFKADSTYAAVLTGKAAEAYASTLRDDITGQESVLTSEVSVLKSKLANATGKQKAAIQKELTKVTGQLQSVQEQVVQTLQGAVQTLQQHVGTQFAKVQAQLLTELGKKFFQNGLLTPLEQQLADMTAVDTATGLAGTLASAQKQYADDLAAAADTVTLAADQTAIDQAARSITENNLAIAAAAQRKTANDDYAAASLALTDKLDVLADAFQNGTGTIADLASVAAEFGLQLDTANTPSLGALGFETDNLVEAFKSLADYIAKITGTRPDTGSGYNPITDPGIGHTAAGPELVPSGAPDALGRYLAGHGIGVHPMAAGGAGRVKMPTLFYSAGDEDFAFSGEGSSFGSIGGGGIRTVEVPVYLNDREVARLVADAFGTDGQAGRIAAQNIDPHLSKVVKV